MRPQISQSIAVVAGLAVLVGCSTNQAGQSSPSPSESPTTGSSPTIGPLPTIASIDVRSQEPGEPDHPLLERDGQWSAGQLEAEPVCGTADPRASLVRLRWVPAPIRAIAQRVDVTIYSERFDDGRFDSSPDLSPEIGDLEWPDPAPGAVHFWRVLTLHSDGWTPSETAKFTPGACIGDYVTSP